MRVLRSGRERGRGRGTQRVPSGRVCAWCRRAGRDAGECTWKANGPQDKFTCAADVRRACAGHMIASVWDGTRVRWENKYRLKRYRSASIAGRGSHVPQHDWAEHVLDACKYEELLAAASAGSSDSGSSSDHWSDSDSSSEEQATSVDAAATHRDWGTKYAGVDTLLRRAVVLPGELRGQGLQCRWCSHVPVQGESCYATLGSGQVRGVVEELLAAGGGVARVRLQDGSVVECPAGSLVAPGARASCTAYSGAAPSERNLGTVCMGHLVAYVAGIRLVGQQHRVGPPLSEERLDTLQRVLASCRDAGGVPSRERVWVSHIAAAAKLETLNCKARLAATASERESADYNAKWFRDWGSVFGGTSTLFRSSGPFVRASAGVADPFGRAGAFVPAGEHRPRWVAKPAACDFCGSWGVEAMSTVTRGKRHFGRECCGCGSVVSQACADAADALDAAESTSESDEGSSEEASSSDSDLPASGGRAARRAVMPVNELDALVSVRHVPAAWAAVDDGMQKYIDILFGSDTKCANTVRCGECVPCMARVARKHTRQANNALCLSSIAFEQSDALVAAGGGSASRPRGGGPALGGHQPSVTHSGRVYHRFPALRESRDAAIARQAQVYILDPESASQQRAATLRARGRGTTPADRRALRSLYSTCDSLFRECNPYVQAYRYAAEAPASDVSFYFDASRRPAGEHVRKYNPPGVNEICALVSVPGVDAAFPQHAVQLRGSGAAHTISDLHRSLDMFHYTLMHPLGGDGWSAELRDTSSPSFTLARYYSYLLQWRRDHANTTMRFGRLTQELAVDSAMRIEFQRLRFMANHQENLRASSYAELVTAERENRIHETGRPTCQHTVLPSSFVGGPRDMSNRLQDSLRVMQVCGTPAFFVTMTCSNESARGLCEAAWHGSRCETPGDCNCQDMPEMGVKVFRAQVEQLVSDARNGCFGPYQAHCYAIEFQKRGLPHVHMLVWTKDTRSVRDTRIDSIIAAEASRESDIVFTLQMEKMLHACREASADGGKDGKIGCIDSQTGHCSKGFAKQWAAETRFKSDGFPVYLRRSRADGQGFGRELETASCAAPRLAQYARDTKLAAGRAAGGDKRDNGYIVPTSAVLLNKYGVHINVEAVGSASVVKYLHKYIHKGVERIHAGASERGRDEIEQFTDFRYMSSCRAYWGHYGYPIHGMFPSVVALPVSFLGWEELVYPEGCEAGALENGPARNALRAFYDAVTEAHRLRRVGGADERGLLGGVYAPRPARLRGGRRRAAERVQLVPGPCRDGRCLVRFPGGTTCAMAPSKLRYVKAIDSLTYPMLPQYFRFDIKEREWVMRKQNSHAIGRVHFAHPSSGDRFFLRLLLHHVVGPAHEQSLFVVDGVEHQTLRAAALARGLLATDYEYTRFMKHACDVLVSPVAVRSAFCGLVQNCTVADAVGLLRTIHGCQPMWKHMCHRGGAWEDVLADISSDLTASGVDPARVGIEPAPSLTAAVQAPPSVLARHLLYAGDKINSHGQVCDAGEDQGAWAAQARGLCNREQAAVVDAVVAAVQCGQGGCYFLEAIAGAGKTFAANAIIARLRANGKIVAATAATGVASTHLLRGGTTHKTFSVPVHDLAENQPCNFTRGDYTGDFVRHLDLIVLDEGPMQHRFVLEALDISCRDVRRSDVPFGGVVMLVAGDFRQNCPVITRASGQTAKGASILSSRLWPSFQANTFRLVENMRMRAAPGLLGTQVGRYHLRVGNGTANVNPADIGDRGGGGVTCARADRTVVPVPSFMRVADGLQGSDVIDEVCSWVFGSGLAIACSGASRACTARSGPGYAAGRRVLAPHNASVWNVTARICERLGPPDGLSRSIDTSNGEGRGYVASEDLNGIETASLPPHELEMRVGHPYMLLRNFKGKHMNGSVYTLRAFDAVSMLLEPEHGCDRDGWLLLPRVDLLSDPHRVGVDFRRRQFPVRLAWACTIHKAQGATLIKYVVLLDSDCFGHGQAYTAITRGSRVDSCGVRVPPGCIDDVNGEAYVRNVVEPCLLMPGSDTIVYEALAARSPPATPHASPASVAAARKNDFGRLEHCVCCGKGDAGGPLLACYSCENAVHERCVCEMRHALSSWADAVRLHEHYGGGSGSGGHLVCPQCYNDYHEAARVSTHCDRGYLGRQGVETIWERESR